MAGPAHRAAVIPTRPAATAQVLQMAIQMVPPMNPAHPAAASGHPADLPAADLAAASGAAAQEAEWVVEWAAVDVDSRRATHCTIAMFTAASSDWHVVFYVVLGDRLTRSDQLDSASCRSDLDLWFESTGFASLATVAAFSCTSFRGDS
jgi:hypothetical protein